MVVDCSSRRTPRVSNPLKMESAGQSEVISKVAVAQSGGCVVPWLPSSPGLGGAFGETVIGIICFWRCDTRLSTLKPMSAISSSPPAGALDMTRTVAWLASAWIETVAPGGKAEAAAARKSRTVARGSRTYAASKPLGVQLRPLSSHALT
ncbi:hypothetical protein G6F40_016185 [Rhizopus arrhizus]|nr:hypothetical protein G6F40_016185 [Rhizopus arrhizus]